jgi:hypothetical protein
VTITLEVANPVRPRVFCDGEIFAVERHEPDFDFPRKTADAPCCRNVDVAGSDFSNSKLATINSRRTVSAGGARNVRKRDNRSRA